MGRNKINIELIQEERNRQITFHKRKAGLIKKAMELSILSGCQIELVIFSQNNELHEYTSNGDPRGILQKYCMVANLPHELLSNADYSTKASKKPGKKRANSADSAPSSDDENLMDIGSTTPAAVAAPSIDATPSQHVLQQPQQLQQNQQQHLPSMNNGYEAVSAELMQQLATLSTLQQSHFEQVQQAQQLFQMAAANAQNAQVKTVQVVKQEAREEEGAQATREGTSLSDLLEPMTPKTAAFVASQFTNASFSQQQIQQALQQEQQQFVQESNNQGVSRILIHEPRAKRVKLPELNVSVQLPQQINVPFLRSGGYISQAVTAPPTPTIDSLLASPTSEFQQAVMTPTTPSN